MEKPEIKIHCFNRLRGVNPHNAMLKRGNRKQAMLKALRPIKYGRYGNGYSVMKHMTWLWQFLYMQGYNKGIHAFSRMIDKLLFFGYRFTPNEMATVARAMRKGNTYYFTDFEYGNYVPSERDIEKVMGKLQKQSVAEQFRYEKHINGMIQKYGKKEYDKKFRRGLEHIAKQLEARGVNMHMKPAENIPPIELSEIEMRGHELGTKAICEKMATGSVSVICPKCGKVPEVQIIGKYQERVQASCECGYVHALELGF